MRGKNDKIGLYIGLGSTIAMAIALGTIWYIKYEVMYYIHISQYFPSSGTKLSWARTLAMVLPKDRQTVGWFRYYLICPIIRTLILGRGCWRCMLQMLRPGYYGAQIREETTKL
jgi:hypothetical protein